MHIEIQMAISFVASHLYDQLPRRRVNIFGEELERALKEKFIGHWYPEAPEKGSAFRCLKVGTATDPVDPVLEKAAYNSGMDVADILENLPPELSIWIDPAEVSYRIGDKAPAQVLYSPDAATMVADMEVARFNPEAQCFRPNGGKVSPTLSGVSSGSSISGGGKSANPSPTAGKIFGGGSGVAAVQKPAKVMSANSAAFVPRTNAPTFTTATFAQTKFGSTKLKNNAKRATRMSPTEFSNYIKQRAQFQQLGIPFPQQQAPLTPQQQQQMHAMAGLVQQQQQQQPQQQQPYAAASYRHSLHHYNDFSRYQAWPDEGSAVFTAPLMKENHQEKLLMENFKNFTLNSGPPSPYQHMLCAN